MAYCLFIAAKSSSPRPTKSKRIRKRTVVEYVATEGTRAAPTTTSGTDEELREAFEAVEQGKGLEEVKGPQEKAKEVEDEVNIISWLYLQFLSFISSVSDFCLCAGGNPC